jgi:hypothetical protein
MAAVSDSVSVAATWANWARKRTPTWVICGHRVRARAVSRCCRLDFVEAGGVAIAASCLSLLALEDEQLAGLRLRPVAE